MIALDIKYAREKTLWLDLKIILKTVPALITQIQDTRRERRRLPRTVRAGGRRIRPGRQSVICSDNQP